MKRILFSLHLMDILPLFCWNVIKADAYIILSSIANINNLSINFMYKIVFFLLLLLFSMLSVGRMLYGFWSTIHNHGHSHYVLILIN